MKTVPSVYKFSINTIDLSSMSQVTDERLPRTIRGCSKRYEAVVEDCVAATLALDNWQPEI